MNTETTFKNKAYKKLYRSRNAEIAGVCAGIADYYDLDALVVRILAILITMSTLGMAAIAYFVLWAHLPLEPQQLGPYDVSFESPELSGHATVNYYLLPEQSLEKEKAKLPLGGLSIAARMFIVVVFFLFFLILSANLSPLIEGARWWQFWPLLLLAVGLFFLVVPMRLHYVVAWHAAGLVLTALSIILLPMSLGTVSWLTVSYTFTLFGPIFLIAVVLFGIGIWMHANYVLLMGALCFVLFCGLGVFFCMLPGAYETSLLPFQSFSVFTIPLLLD